MYIGHQNRKFERKPLVYSFCTILLSILYCNLKKKKRTEQFNLGCQQVINTSSVKKNVT